MKTIEVIIPALIATSWTVNGLEIQRDATAMDSKEERILASLESGNRHDSSQISTQTSSNSPMKSKRKLVKKWVSHEKSSPTGGHKKKKKSKLTRKKAKRSNLDDYSFGVEDPSSTQAGTQPANNIDFDESFLDDRDSSPQFDGDLLDSINNGDSHGAESFLVHDDTSKILHGNEESEIPSTFESPVQVDEEFSSPNLENSIMPTTYVGNGMVAFEDKNARPGFGFEFIFTTPNPSAGPINRISDEDKISFEIIHAAQNPSPTGVECANAHDAEVSEINVEFFYTIETSNIDIQTVLNSLENDMLQSVAKHLCPNLERRQLMQNQEYEKINKIMNHHTSHNLPRRLEVVNVDSLPTDEILLDPCIPEVFTNTCTRIRGQMTAYYSEEGQNSNIELVTMNVILALQFAMSENNLVNEDIGLYKVTYLDTSTTNVELTQILNEQVSENDESQSQMLPLLFFFFGFLVIILMFSLQRRMIRRRYAMEEADSVVFSDFDSNSSHSGNPSPSELCNGYRYRIDTIKEENEAYGSDDESVLINIGADL